MLSNGKEMPQVSCDTQFICLAFPVEYHVGRRFYAPPKIGINLRMVELKKEQESPPHVIISCIGRYLYIILPIGKDHVGARVFTPLLRHPPWPSIRRYIPYLAFC